MSATFKNSKKQSQNEIRRFMNEHKEKIRSIKKIESPLAKYNDLGQLTCILCQSVVKSEVVWTVHVNSKQHKEKIEKAKKFKEKTSNFTNALKRPASPLSLSTPKKLKGILKNTTSDVEVTTCNTSLKVENENLPKNFFDKSSRISEEEIKNTEKRHVEKNENVEVKVDLTLPEGFFDDPKQDAKARNVEYKDPVEEEWDRFQREIREADSASAAIIAEDQDEATTERQIDEIEEQMRNWSRVLVLEKKKIEVVTHMSNDQQMENDEIESDDEVDVDKIFNWRSKKSF